MPSVLTANMVPLLFGPPLLVVPYSVLPDKSNPAYADDPSLLVEALNGKEGSGAPAEKVWRVVKVCADTCPASNEMRMAVNVVCRNRFRERVFMNSFNRLQHTSLEKQ